MVSNRTIFYVQISFLVVIGYFTFHIFHGDRGVYAHKNLKTEISYLSNELDMLKFESSKLKTKINNLGSINGQVDPDLLLENMRELGYVKQEEIMLIE